MDYDKELERISKEVARLPLRDGVGRGRSFRFLAWLKFVIDEHGDDIPFGVVLPLGQVRFLFWRSGERSPLTGRELAPADEILRTGDPQHEWLWLLWVVTFIIGLALGAAIGGGA